MDPALEGENPAPSESDPFVHHSLLIPTVSSDPPIKQCILPISSGPSWVGDDSGEQIAV